VRVSLNLVGKEERQQEKKKGGEKEDIDNLTRQVEERGGGEPINRTRGK